MGQGIERWQKGWDENVVLRMNDGVSCFSFVFVLKVVHTAFRIARAVKDARPEVLEVKGRDLNSPLRMTVRTRSLHSVESKLHRFEVGILVG